MKEVDNPQFACGRNNTQ